VEIDKETYLRPHEAVALVRQLRGCSTGWAAELVDRAIKSGRVRTHDGGVQNFSRPSERRNAALETNGNVPPARKVILPNKTDLLYWLDQKLPLPQTVPAQTLVTNTEKIRRIVTEYIRANPDGTMAGAWEFASSKGVIGQDLVRHEYRKQSGRRRVGRRRKSVRK
jgi:hypothetical protein